MEIRGGSLKGMILVLLISVAWIASRYIPLKCPDVGSHYLSSLLCYGRASINCFKSEDELKALLTLIIGGSRAEKVVEVLQSRKVYSYGELEELKGVGPKSVEKIGRFFTLEKCSAQNLENIKRR